MARLKLHPRDSLPNATALAHADAVYTELVAEPRHLLSQAIARFRLGLEGQDPGKIDRERLMRLLDDMRAESAAPDN